MAIRIGINGFGRIGRTVFRIIMANPDKFDLVGINLRNANMDYIVYSATYDSVHGRLPFDITYKGNHLIVNGKNISVLSASTVEDIRWDECGAEYIVESTGAYNTTSQASDHFLSGAKRVVITAPAKDRETPTFVMGVNHLEYDPAYKVVSNASCTTNCLAPLAKVVHERFGIEQGLMSTIHSATSKQKAVDSRAGRDRRTGRSVFNNIIPSTTGAAKAVGRVIPELNGKLTGMSFRVPTNDVSVVDLTARLAKRATYAEVIEALRDASRNEMKGVMTCVNADIVSGDMRGETHTCIVDEKAGIMLDDNFIKLIAWYDNEWGYSTKVLELVEHVYNTCEGKAKAPKAAKESKEAKEAKA